MYVCSSVATTADGPPNTTARPRMQGQFMLLLCVHSSAAATAHGPPEKTARPSMQGQFEASLLPAPWLARVLDKTVSAATCHFE